MSHLRAHPPLTQKGIALAANALGEIDPDFARLNAALGAPPLWERDPGFPTLVQIILEQQVSLASAAAAYNKLQEAILEVTPHNFLTLDDVELKKIGFSRQKTGYCRGLAFALAEHTFDLDSVAEMDDQSARTALVSLKGIGRWTADIYLLMALLRPDIWPVGDLALVAALQRLKKMPGRPLPDEFDRIAEPWKPWRAVAARMLWQYYLSPKYNQPDF